MSEANRLYSQDLPVIATGAGIEALVITGGIAVIESSHNIALKVVELGAAAVCGALGIAIIAQGVQGIRDRRYSRDHPQQSN